MNSNRAQANKRNARSSTGPKTAVGKSRSSANALSHGVLSGKLLLADESAGDYHALLQSLMTELGPVGTMEQLLVERIAVSVWRQRRLVGAEAAAVAEQQSTTAYQVLHRVRTLAGLTGKDDDWVKAILEDLPPVQIFEEEIAHLTQLAESGDDVPALKKGHPYIWQSLCDEAEVDESAGHASQCDTAQDYVDANYGSLGAWVGQKLYETRKTLKVVKAGHTVRAALAIPTQADLVSRYQAALDNEWFKSLRALREAQKHRLDQAALNAKPV
jgi:hypothetical protein